MDDTRATGLILCGGSAERLGGIDKPLRPLAGRRLVDRVAERLAPQVGALLLSANRNLADYARWGRVVSDDAAYAGCGPLAGLQAGLAATATRDLLCVPGDAPALPRDLAARLAAARGSAAIAYAHDGHGPQPLCCLLRRDLHDDLRGWLEAGGRTPRQWFARHAAVAVDFSEIPRWAWSVNTPEEWAAAESRLDPAPSSPFENIA